MVLDALETEILEALRTIEKKWSTCYSSDKECTRALKDVIGDIGERIGFRVFACGSKFEGDGEWLFDMTWVREDNGTLMEVPLVLECEWTPSKIVEDFEKLLVARADHRVFILWASSSALARARIASLVAIASRSRLTRRGDRYLLACFTDESERFEIEGYVAEKAAAA